MKWIPTQEVEPSALRGVVSGRFGGSVMFVYFDKLLQRWEWVYGGGGAERIEEPPELFLDPDWAAAHPRTSPVVRPERKTIRRTKSAQLLLEL